MGQETQPLGKVKRPGAAGAAAWAWVSRARVLSSYRILTWGALAAIVLFALSLRLYNINWDEYQHLHPDERHISLVSSGIDIPGSIGEYFDSSSSPLNPYNRDTPSFVYGTFPIFLNKIVTEVVDELDGDATIDRSDYNHVNLYGRLLSALFDAGTVFVVFLLGRRLYGAGVGLLAALLLASAAFAIQHAHFFVVDPFLTFFVTLTLYFAVRIAQGGGWQNYALAGLALGLGTASKVTAVALTPILGLAVLMRLWPTLRDVAAGWLGDAHGVTAWGSRPAAIESAGRPLVRALLGLGLVIFLGFLAFRVAQPYAFEAPSWGDLKFWEIRLDPRWVQDQRNQNVLLGGDGAFPPSVQWIGRTAYLFPLQNMILWGMGPALGVAAWAGFAYAAWRLLARREPAHLLPLAWVAIYFLFMGRQFSLYMRYFLPLYPALALFAALLLLHVWRFAKDRALLERVGKAVRRMTLALPAPARGAPAAARAEAASERALGAFPVLARGAVVLVVVATLLWGLAYVSIYSRPVSRLEASDWMFDNLPNGAVIATEHWDDVVPLGLPGSEAKGFSNVQLPVFELDSPQKLDQMASALDQADYLVVSSNRGYGSIRRVPAPFPMMRVYYDELFAGKLGYRRIATFTSYPGLLGVSIPDDSAEESFTVYDHPKVMVFEKAEDFSKEKLISALSASAPESAVNLLPGDADQNALLLRPADLEKQQSGGTFTDIFDADSFTNRFPAISWLLVVQLVSLSLLPLAVFAFRALPDGGYLLTKPLGILGLAYLVWLGTSLKVFDFTRGSIIAVAALMLALGVAAALRFRRQVIDYLRQHWRGILFAEALFLGAFLIFYFIRLNNPDLWHPFRGGEKPMDFAYLNAVTRSTTMPPYDPWFAGGYINYYYFGQFITATLTKLTGILPEVSFNLAVPLFFALTVGAAFSLGYNLAEAARRSLRWRPGRLPIAAWTPVGAGLLAVLLVAIVGNLNGADLMVDRLSAVSPWHSDRPLLDSVVGTIGGVKETVFGGAELGPFDYWAPSRIIRTTPSNNAITEFPFFTFMFADLHAHLMAIPFAITSLGMGLALVLSARSRENPPSRLVIASLLVVMLGLVVGALRWINSWDYPPFLLMALAAVFLAGRAWGGRFDLRRAGMTLGFAAVLGVLSWGFFLPASSNYALPATGFQGLPDDLPRTPFHQYLAHFGLFLFLVGSFLGFLAYRAVRLHGIGGWLPVLVVAVVGMFAAAVLFVGLAGLVVGLIPGFTIHDLSAMDFLADLFSNNVPVAAFALFGLGVVALLVWQELRRRRPDGHVRLLVLAMVALALFLSAGVEVAVLDPDIGRQNTVFKFYLHIWILLALASSFAAWYLLAVLRPPTGWLRRLAQGRLALRRGTAPRLAFVAGLAILLLAALIYPVEGTRWRVRQPDRFTDTGLTSNGFAFMPAAVYGDPQGGEIEIKYTYDAIRWLRSNVEGSPVIIEAQTPEYRWGSRFATYTGLPAVIGWRWHQTQQRDKFAFLVEQRGQDVAQFYNTPDPMEAERLLHKYGVSYVIVGEVERLYYSPEGITKFDRMIGTSLEMAYENPGVKIYRVMADAVSAHLAQAIARQPSP